MLSAELWIEKGKNTTKIDLDRFSFEDALVLCPRLFFVDRWSILRALLNTVLRREVSSALVGLLAFHLGLLVTL